MSIDSGASQCLIQVPVYCMLDVFDALELVNGLILGTLAS